MGPKILFFDLETAPNLAYVWGMYEQNALSIEQNWFIMTVGYRWGDMTKAKAVNLHDVDPGAVERGDDSTLVHFLWELIDEADIVIGHNVDKFDLRKSNARFLFHGLQPPRSYQTIDTLKVARKYFAFNSNRLGDLGQHLGVGAKEETGGFSLWLNCLKGDPVAWEIMGKYCRQDVDLLVLIYERLRPWIKNHPNLGVFEGGHRCPSCGGTNLHRRGYQKNRVATYQRWQCQDCAAYSKDRKQLKTQERPELVPGG
jgi:hypothetical protein